MNPDVSGYLFDGTWQGLVSLALAVLLPILVGLFTKASWPAGVKAVLLLLLVAAKSFGEAFLAAAPGEFNVEQVAWVIGVNFVIAVAVQFGLWRPTGVTDMAQNALVRDRDGG